MATQALDNELDVAALDQDFGGQLITPDKADYDQARAVFNGAIDRHPSVIARCTGVADVISALEFGRANELPIAVRGGGHAVAGHAVCDDGIVIDLAPMKGIWVDPERRTARAQAGLTWGEFDRETQRFGLAVTGGRVKSTGIAGLTLGSGSGWLERKYGLTCDSLLSADVITPDGRLVRASDEENAELFWGLRGGGGNFGIVTSFEYRLFPVGPIVLAGMLLYERSRAAEVLSFWRDYVDEAPDDVCTGLALTTAPPLPFVPEGLRGKPAVGLLLMHAGSLEEAERELQPMRAFGPPAADLVHPMPYTAVQGMVDDFIPHGAPAYWKSDNLRQLDDGAIETLVDVAAQVISPWSFVILEPKGRAVARVADDAMAISGRDGAVSYYGFGVWERPEEADAEIAWARSLASRMRPFAVAGIAPHFDSDSGRDRLRSTYGDAKYERLVALKRAYDPDNVFHHNQNIPPE